ncbi:hypothetical protein F2Q69_00015852 [Brassica cretica]|uniref:Uncharacterized protein n=1 Tax=Brassica cretica TaxID=69181 RepID=A0A8S9QZE0_BRACR|nr:hypothetical protein F2Q69_00015852 [Brassica cretica]
MMSTVDFRVLRILRVGPTTMEVLKSSVHVISSSIHLLQFVSAGGTPPIKSLSLFFYRGGATFLFWKAINMKCRGELMGVDMLLLHAMVKLMPATVNV